MKVDMDKRRDELAERTQDENDSGGVWRHSQSFKAGWDAGNAELEPLIKRLLEELGTKQEALAQAHEALLMCANSVDTRSPAGGQLKRALKMIEEATADHPARPPSN